MDERELRELEDESSWDDEGITVHPPVKNPRSIVSVAFSTADFTRVAQHARQKGMKLSEFIRTAALERVETDAPRVTIQYRAANTGIVHDDYTSASGNVGTVEFSTPRRAVTT
jgi:hypothetical protein